MNILGRYAVSTDVRESPTLEVRERPIVLLYRWANVGLQIVLDGSLLVGRTGEIVAKTTSAANPSFLGADGYGSSNSRDIRARSRKLRGELGSLIAIIALARRTNAVVAGGLEHGDTAQTHDADHVANFDGIFLGDSLLIVSIGIGDDLGK